MITYENETTFKLARLERRVARILDAPLAPRTHEVARGILWDIKTEMVTRSPLERRLARFYARVTRGGRW